MGIEITEKANFFCLFCFNFDYRRRRQQTADSSSRFNIPPITSVFVFILLMLSAVFPATSGETLRRDHHSFRPHEETNKTHLVKEHLMKINKPFVKSIQSPDGDTIDCVLIHLQPAFDHPLLKGTKPLDPPERPYGYDHGNVSSANYQVWSLSGESCPEGTIPIRRTSEQDILRASSVKRFGRKMARPASRDPYTHEHAVAYGSGDKYYGAKASLNVWAPKVANRYEFSLTQFWIMAGSFGNDMNTIEAGWQVSPQMYGDNRPRLFIYWTSDGYGSTGCYNLQCSGFVQTNNRVAIGTAIYPVSVFNGRQFDMTLMVWKDTASGNWWLEWRPGMVIGYWPASLFTHLRGHATMVQFGGEVVDTRAWGPHTTTHMGTGHFPNEGYGKAAFVRNMEVVNWDNKLYPLYSFKTSAERPSCYDVRPGTHRVWGSYIYFGGPGKNPRCP